MHFCALLIIAIEGCGRRMVCIDQSRLYKCRSTTFEVLFLMTSWQSVVQRQLRGIGWLEKFPSLFSLDLSPSFFFFFFFKPWKRAIGVLRSLLVELTAVFTGRRVIAETSNCTVSLPMNCWTAKTVSLCSAFDSSRLVQWALTWAICAWSDVPRVLPALITWKRYGYFSLTTNVYCCS